MFSLKSLPLFVLLIAPANMQSMNMFKRMTTLATKYKKPLLATTALTAGGSMVFGMPDHATQESIPQLPLVQWSKNFQFSNIFFGQVFAAGADQPQVLKKDIPTQHIFEQFTKEKFVGNAHNFLIKTTAGRLVLMNHRAAEILRDLTPIGVVVHSDAGSQRFIRVGSSLLYKDDVAYYTRPQTTPLHFPIHRLHAFVTGIAAIEKCLLECTDLDKRDQELLERTRVHDLYLLKAILENDNHIFIQEAQPYSLPEIVAETHAEWHFAPLVVHPTSAYQVVQEALEQRKLNGTDALDKGTFEETWTSESHRKEPSNHEQ